MANKPQINYLARDFESIKTELTNYAKRFYPNQYADFTEASFGSFLLDAVSYLGDVVSFQLDYQANENLLTTAINRDNILAMARQLGYTDPLSPNVSGFVTIYLNIPATADNSGPNRDYLPVLKEGTAFSTDAGAVFTLSEDLDFTDDDVEFTVSEVNSNTGIPTKYAAKKMGQVVSGETRTLTVVVEDRSAKDDFYLANIEDENIIEVISVKDSEGNDYYEVESLTQNLIYESLLNEDSTASNTIKVLKPKVAARRFMVKYEDDTVSLIFGNGKEDSDSSLDSINDPTKVVLQKYAKDYVSKTTLDPTVLNVNDKLGIGPSNTNLTIIYRANTSELVSAPALSLINVDSARYVFPIDAVDEDLVADVQGSIELENEEPIIGSRVSFTDEEIKQIAMSMMTSQNRIVTTQDYVSFAYRMPAQFGTIKRAVALRDDFSPRRAINLYVLSANDDDEFALAPQSVKDNLKTWLSQYKSISDSVDILDGKIINFGIRYSFITNRAFTTTVARFESEQILREYFDRRKYNFGESINISEILKQLNDSEMIDDVTKIEFYSASGGVYSDVVYDFKKNTTSDERFIKIPENYVFEIKLYASNITGEAI